MTYARLNPTNKIYSISEIACFDRRDSRRKNLFCVSCNCRLIFCEGDAKFFLKKHPGHQHDKSCIMVGKHK